MPHPFDIGDYGSTLIKGLSGFWLRFFRDTRDLEAYYQASEQYLGQVYLDLLSNVLSTGIVDTPVFNKEYWKLFLIGENEISFSEGLSVAEDRYTYDMPGPIVDVTVMQNTIFDPDITFEEGVDFDLLDADGYLRFVVDPFRTYQDVDTGEWLPRPGLGWRWQTLEVGNNFTDVRRPMGLDWNADTAVKRGDTLRLLAHAGVELQSGTSGQILNIGSLIFRDTLTPAAFSSVNVGDIIQVYEDPSSLEYIGYYVVKEVNSLFPTQVVLEATYGAPTITSAATLRWRHYKGMYFDLRAEDYEVDYIRGDKLVGKADTPYPLEYNTPIVYAVVRDPADDDELGVTINAYPTESFVGHKHLIPDTVKVAAYRNDGFQVQEGVDYTVDYLRGVVHPIAYLLPAPPGDLTKPNWSPTSTLNQCSYSYQEEVLLGSGGLAASQVEGQVRQISLWVPEVEVDRFILYENYGYLLNRFGASSDTYKAFLRGIMYLYTSGPVLYRVNAALNVAAGFPVIASDGEVLQDYDGGVDGEGSNGQIFGLGVDHFSTPTYMFSELDVGGYVVFSNTLNDANKGRFRILEVVGPNTVVLESEYGLVNEGPPLTWVVTRTYTKTVYVTTEDGTAKTYTYPYDVPMLDLVTDSDNFHITKFFAFDYLTEAFNVVDYIEDPQWWVNKYIPDILWANQPASRRLATDLLFPNVINPEDDALIGDPGFYIGADDTGNTFTPTDPYTSLPADLYRHTAAFILFDKYLKFHMFYIGIDNSVELDSQFLADLEELILVVKPAYTYPYVEPGDAFFDSAELWDTFLHNIVLDMSGSNGDNVQIANNAVWTIGAPFNIGDYFRYVTYSAQPTGQPSPPVGVFTLPVLPSERVVSLRLNATVNGGTREVLEGVDYTFDYDPTSPTKWQVTLIGAAVWDVLPVLTFEALVIAITNIVLGLPDTTIGFTPLSIGITSPGYVRESYTPIPEVTEFIDRALSLHIDVNYPFGVPYTY